MDPKNKDVNRLIASNETEKVPRLKGKEKARKELWDSLCAVYENEADKENDEVALSDLEEWTVTNADSSMRALTHLATTNPQILSAAVPTFIGKADLLGLESVEKEELYEKKNTVQHKVKLQQIKDTDEHIQDCCGDQLRHTKYGLKLNRKTKSRHLKNLQKNENDNIKSKLEKDKEKRRYKECDRQRKICSSVPEGFSKEEEKNVPSVIVLHKYKKGMLNSQIEPYNEEANSLDKVTHRPEKSWKKSHTDRKTNSQKQITIDKSSCNEFEVEGKHSLDYKQQLRDKNKKKRDKVVVYKTLSTNLDAKLRKKRRKLERQQTLKEVACTLNTDTDIYDKIKNLPMKIDENQLIFMHPSHVAKALEHIKLKKNNQETINTNVPSNELNRSRSKCNNQEDKNSEASLKSKMLMDKNSSKKLKILSSIKKMKKSIPVVLEEKSDISFIKVSKQKKGPSKRRSKIVSTGIHKNILEEPEVEENSGNNSKAKSVNEPIPVKDYLTGRFSVSRQNVCFGDNSIDLNTVHNKLVPPLNDSLYNYKSKMSSTECNLKSSPAKELKIRRINKKEMEKLKKLIGKNDENENKNQPDLNEDESKLTFQLLKSNAKQKNLERLRKNVYSISDRMGSKENINPTEQNDRLYVTKRMLFYSNKESTSTSKESLNIAIRRDTEISNSGSSNNVLNVVIKQKKNSNTSTKSVNSPKLSIENKCSKHCDTKSLEKMFVENYLGQVYKNNDIKKCKQLKEAECQTEENTFSSDTQVEKMMEVSTQPFELSKNILQDEFRNFLTYHLKNMNPSLWNNNKISNINEEEPDRNQHFQPGTHKLGAQSKLGDNNQPILLNANVESLISKKQYGNNECDDNAKHYCNSDLYPFLKVLNSEEFNLQNSKCDQDYCVSKINAFFGKEVGRNIGNENKIILKPEVSIYENQCKKTESENIAEKLKNIGLSDKTSFIKVINSNNKLDTSIRKVNTHSVINFKTMKSPRVTKGALTKPFRVSMRENLKNGKTRRQRSKFFLPTNLMNVTDELGNDNSLYSSYDQNKKKYGPVNSREKYLFEKNISDRSNVITNNFWHLEEKHNNKPIITTGDNYDGVKQNFINVLSENDDMLPKARKMAKHIFEATKKNSYRMLRNFIGSGAGIQSETYDLQSVPYKNIGCVKIEQSKIEPIRDKQNTKEPGYFPEDPMLFNKKTVNKQISTYDISAHTPEKRPFLHVINSKFNTDTGMNENKNNVVSEKNKTTFHSFNFCENKDENSCIFKTTVEENQIVDKINAVYDFLQYLEKMLKDSSSFLKVSGNTKNTNTIGHFNNTLRCLCNNCIEILNKIEVQKIENDDTKSVENLISHPVNKAFYPAQVSGEIKNELHLNGINSSQVQYVTLNETKNNVNLFRDLMSNNESVNPFCVIVKQEEKSHNQNHGFLKNTDHFERENLGNNNHSFEFKEKSYEDFIKRKFIVMSDAISSNKIVNSRNIGNEENNNRTVNNSNDRFCKEIQGGHMSSVDNSSEIAQVNLATNNGCEAKSRLVVKRFNHSLNYQPLESQSDKHLCDNYFQNQDPSQEFNSKTYSSSVKNVSSKNNMGSPCPKNGFCQYVTSRKDLEYVHLNQINNSETDKRNNINNSGQCNECYHVRSCKNTPEATVYRNNEVEMKHKLTCQHEIKSVSDSANFSNKSENTNYCMKCKMITPSYFNNQCKDINNIDEKFAMSKCKDKNNIDEKFATSNNQRHTENFDGSSNQMPFTNIYSPRGSIIIIKRNLQKDSSKYTSSSNSVEYLNSSSKCDHEREKRQESKEFDSDGWVPLNDITEIGNNQICLGMDINNMTVRHIEYVQKFPESFSNLK